jgi:hypothetical protein
MAQAQVQVVQLPAIVHPIQLPPVRLEPLPVAGPQPNFVNLDQHIDGVRQELGRFANLPGAANRRDLQHLNDGLQAVVQGLNQLIDAVRDNTVAVKASYVSIS